MNQRGLTLAHKLLLGTCAALAVGALYPVNSLADNQGERVGFCTAIDGDTLDCGGERIRLIGIDAPEKPGHCRPGRRCVEGDWRLSRFYLDAMLGGRLTIERFGIDRYGRTLADVKEDGDSLSCRMVNIGVAEYRPDWDERSTVRRCLK